MAIAIGVLGGVAGIYGSLWLGSMLYYEVFRTWSEPRTLLVLVPLGVLVGGAVGVTTAVVSRTSVAPRAAIVVILVASLLTFAIGGGGHFSGWLTALVMYVVLAGGVYLGGVVVAGRWLRLPEPGSE